MANEGVPNASTTRIFITLRSNDLEYLDEKHTVVGEVVEGLEDLEKVFNEVYVDEKFRPLQDIRILHTFVLDDPFDDYEGMNDGYESPKEEVPKEETVAARLR